MCDARTVHKSVDCRIRDAPRLHLTTNLPPSARSCHSLGLEFTRIVQAWHRNRYDIGIPLYSERTDDTGTCQGGEFSLSDAAGNAGARSGCETCAGVDDCNPVRLSRAPV